MDAALCMIGSQTRANNDISIATSNKVVWDLYPYIVGNRATPVGHLTFGDRVSHRSDRETVLSTKLTAAKQGECHVLAKRRIPHRHPRTNVRL